MLVLPLGISFLELVAFPGSHVDISIGEAASASRGETSISDQTHLAISFQVPGDPQPMNSKLQAPRYCALQDHSQSQGYVDRRPEHAA
jgi:hypothetical protein